MVAVFKVESGDLDTESFGIDLDEELDAPSACLSSLRNRLTTKLTMYILPFQRATFITSTKMPNFLVIFFTHTYTLLSFFPVI